MSCLCQSADVNVIYPVVVVVVVVAFLSSVFLCS
jgi:hypothetical protein